MFVLNDTPLSNLVNILKFSLTGTIIYMNGLKKQVLDVKFENKFLPPVLRQVFQSRGGRKHKCTYVFFMFLLKDTPNSNQGNPV